MIILALDTTAVTASVALLDNENLIASFDIHNKLTHSEKLLPMVNQILENSGYTADDIELIAVSTGPGSFTGVRIGIATAKGLAFARNLPIVGVSSLEALAVNFENLSSCLLPEVIICPSMDARRNELYNAIFEYDGYELKRISEDRPISCEELLVELADSNKRIYINGDGAEKLFDFMTVNAPSCNVILSPELVSKQSAVSVGKLGYRAYLNGDFTNSKIIAPTYLRTSQAERVNNKEK